MDALAILKWAMENDVLTLTIVGVVAVYQTRELRACRARDAECARTVNRTRVAIARLYSIIKARAGEADPLPPLDDLMADRRNQHVTE